MKTLYRDVLLLGGAATAFLMLFVVAPVGAQAVPAEEAAPTQLAANDAAVSTAWQDDYAAGPIAASTSTTLPADDGTDDVQVEQRCDQVRRIGKFTITRCD